jgi:acyl carrier protein
MSPPLARAPVPFFPGDSWLTARQRRDSILRRGRRRRPESILDLSNALWEFKMGGSRWWQIPAGTAVTKDVRGDAAMMGIPARQVGFVKPLETPHRRTVIMNDIRATVIKIIYDVCRPEQPDLSNPDRPLLGAHVDSLDFASILMAIEDKFSFQISEKRHGRDRLAQRARRLRGKAHDCMTTVTARPHHGTCRRRLGPVRRLTVDDLVVGDAVVQVVYLRTGGRAKPSPGWPTTGRRCTRTALRARVRLPRAYPAGDCAWQRGSRDLSACTTGEAAILERIDLKFRHPTYEGVPVTFRAEITRILRSMKVVRLAVSATCEGVVRVSGRRNA